MIPKKIHYCWFGGKPLPNDLKKCIKTWKKKCPDYSIIQWDESNFDINSNSFIKDAYNNKAWAFVTDYARLKIIYENGGIYLDTDVKLLKSFDELLKNRAFFAIQQNGLYINTGLCFGAEKGVRIVEELLNSYDNYKFDINNMKDIACPIINTKIFEKYGYKKINKLQDLKDIESIIYPPEFFDPICPDTTNNLLSSKSYSIHLYNSSWLPKKTIIKRKIVNLIGQKRINSIKKIIKKGE